MNTNLETHDLGLVDPLIVGEAGRHFGWVKRLGLRSSNR